MQIAITSTGPSLDVPYDPRFGRAAYLIIVDEGTEAWEAYANPAVDASGGAGIQAAQFAADKGAWAVISGDFGPNAYRALEAANLAMFVAPAGQELTVRQLIHLYRGGKLQKPTGPTQRGHHGMGQGAR
jgi:predicted Fe-Mo cluster-binding NifX family protein